MIDSDSFFICGGVNFPMNDISSSAKRYFINDNRFETLPPMNRIRFNFPCIHYKGRVYVIGGRGYGLDDQAITSNCEYFDIESRAWIDMPSMKVQRCGHQLLIYQEKLYVLGGLSLSYNVKKIEFFDFAKNKWKLTQIKLTFDFFNFEIFPKDNDEFYLIGGFHKYGMSNFILGINLKTKTVRSEGFLKSQRAHLKLFYDRSKNNLIIFGGISPSDPLLRTRYAETYNLITRESSTLALNLKSQLFDIQKFNFNRSSCEISSSLEDLGFDNSDTRERFPLLLIIYLILTITSNYILSYPSLVKNSCSIYTHKNLSLNIY